MANPWFRMYAEFANDPKVQMMSEADQRRFVMLLCIRCSNDGVTLHDEEVAFQLRISSDEWAQTKSRFIERNLIDEDNNPTAWDKRQFVSDSSAARVRKHREKKKQESKRGRNVTATPPDTDTEADTETDKAALTTSPTSQADPGASSAPPGDPEIPDPPGEPPASTPDEAPKRATQLAVLLRRNGADQRTLPNDRRIADWARDGVTDAELLQALETAKARRKAQGSDQPIGTAYLAPIIADIRAAPPEAGSSKNVAAAQDQWWRSEAGIDRKARELGMYARASEDYASFKDRIFEAIRQREPQGART